MNEWAGYRWLSETYHIFPVQKFRVESRISTFRKTTTLDGFTLETYKQSFRPEPNLRGHLTFALKYEGIHLEFLSRLFSSMEEEQLIEWIRSEPTGIYARRAGFFYEWLTGSTLPIDDLDSGNYVDAIDPEDFFTSENFNNNKRWRVRDNLPGTPEYCPVVKRTHSVRNAEAFNCAAALARLETEFGQDVIMRSAVWLTVKESRASFAIEREENQYDRIKRFASVMESQIGIAENPLSPETVIGLQREILGEVATRYGMRQSPVFVGHLDDYTNVVDYIAPHWEHTAALMKGLSETLKRTEGGAAIIRAAVASFGFVYIHPMADGNGRISRFLVNDILRRDGAVPAPFVLPISATITHTARARAGYDQSLEMFSKPLLKQYSVHYRFGNSRIYEDGIKSNFEFDRYDHALFAWKYPDLTTHVEYLCTVIQQTINEEMRSEASYLRSVQNARREIKNRMEGPDSDIDRIIRSIKSNNWMVSNSLRKEFPLLENENLATSIVIAVRDSFEPSTPAE